MHGRSLGRSTGQSAALSHSASVLDGRCWPVSWPVSRSMGWTWPLGRSTGQASGRSPYCNLQRERLTTSLSTCRSLAIRLAKRPNEGPIRRPPLGRSVGRSISVNRRSFTSSSTGSGAGRPLSWLVVGCRSLSVGRLGSRFGQSAGHLSRLVGQSADRKAAWSVSRSVGWSVC